MSLTNTEVKSLYGVDSILELPSISFVGRDDEEEKDMKGYMVLVQLVQTISNPAAEYMKDEAVYLDSFAWSGDLRKAFLWQETQQKYAYWKGIYQQILRLQK